MHAEATFESRCLHQPSLAQHKAIQATKSLARLSLGSSASTSSPFEYLVTLMEASILAGRANMCRGSVREAEAHLVHACEVAKQCRSESYRVKCTLHLAALKAGCGDTVAVNQLLEEVASTTEPDNSSTASTASGITGAERLLLRAEVARHCTRHKESQDLASEAVMALQGFQGPLAADLTQQATWMSAVASACTGDTDLAESLLKDDQCEPTLDSRGRAVLQLQLSAGSIPASCGEEESMVEEEEEAVDWSKCTVVKLRAELKRRGLSSTGDTL